MRRDTVEIWMWRAVLYGLCIALGVFIACVSARAEDITLSWTNPTETITETPAGPYTNPGGTRIWLLVEEVNDPNVTEFTLPDQKPGTYVFAATSFDTEGLESQLSGKATKEVTAFTAPAGATLYQAVTISSGFWFIPSATLNVEVQCDTAQSANDYYRVPIDDITWLPGSDARPIMLVTNECG